MLRNVPIVSLFVCFSVFICGCDTDDEPDPLAALEERSADQPTVRFAGPGNAWSASKPYFSYYTDLLCDPNAGCTPPPFATMLLEYTSEGALDIQGKTDGDGGLPNGTSYEKRVSTGEWKALNAPYLVHLNQPYADNGSMVQDEAFRVRYQATPTPWGLSNGVYETSSRWVWFPRPDDSAFTPAVEIDYALQTCGNGVREGEEACDDGNLAAGDGCTPTCTLPAFEVGFTGASGWSQVSKSAIIPGATVGVELDGLASDGSTLALRAPGDENLNGAAYAGPGAHAAEAVVGAPMGFGRYEFKVRFAACQSDEEMVNGLFTFMNDGTDEDGDGLDDNSEIDIELLCGESKYLSLSVWTDYDNATDAFRKSTRVINMRTGTVRDTAHGASTYGGLSVVGTMPAVVQSDFPNPSKYYHIGFTWTPTAVTYFMMVNGIEVPLWTLAGEEFVPQRPADLRLNLWHSKDHWMTTPSAADYPASDATMRVDWVRVTPL